MHTVNVGNTLGTDQISTVLGAELGAGYTVRAGKSADDLIVKKGALKSAKVTVIPDGGSTEFQVRGAGWLISIRMANERGIARDVADAIERSTALHGG